MIRPEDEFLHAVVPGRNRAQHALNLIGFGDVAAGQQRQRAEAKRAAQHVAAIDFLDQRLVLAQDPLVDPPLGPEHRR